MTEAATDHVQSSDAGKPSLENLKIMILRFALSALLFLGAAASAGGEPALTYRLASYSIGYRVTRESVAMPLDTAMEWAYPVVTPMNTLAHRRLNAWLRGEALKGFETCSPVEMTALRAMSDSKVVATLSADPGFADCELHQAVISPVEAFGRYVMFERRTSWRGQARPQQGVDTWVFDMANGVPVELATLFKPDALEALNEVLAEQIAGDIDRPKCPGRRFSWSQVSLRPPAELFVEYPFSPAEWRDCGDGMERLSGQAVSEQLLHPDRLRPVRRWVQVR